MEPAAVVTMVKDDFVFLRKWVDYYGRQFGRSALHVVSHGGDPEIDRIADGCSVIRIPGGFDAGFDVRRWRFLSQLTGALLAYYRWVICGDVDEYVVADPATGRTLAGILATRDPGAVLTPVGIEVVHRADAEPDGIEPAILGPRRFGRFSTRYCKPCITSVPVRFSRGGHFANHATLTVVPELVLFHMKYCDRPLTIETLRRRAEAAASVDDPSRRASPLSSRWFGAPDMPAAELDAIAARPVGATFDLEERVRFMEATWESRGDGLFGFRKRVEHPLLEIPARFFGTI
ncbi:MAG: glycosyltransferase family 2 protein [Rhodobacteraceae bacterium]|nr:glycosyltransferase family 2 protein [Paracoccaceae bacterium]